MAQTSQAVQHVALLRARMANALLQVSFVAWRHLRVRPAQRLQLHTGTAAKDRVELQLCHMRSSWLLRSRAAGVPFAARICCFLGCCFAHLLGCVARWLPLWAWEVT